MQSTTTTTRQLLAGIADVDAPGRLLSDNIGALQHTGYFTLAVRKSDRRAALRKHFAGAAARCVLLSHGLRHLLAAAPAGRVQTLAPDHFAVAADATEADLQAKAAALQGAIVITENNDAGFHAPGYVRLFEQTRDAVFVVWDQDNHHWLRNSALLAAHCDVYAPAHNDNLYALSRFNACTLAPTPCAVIQWSSPFLAAQVATLLAQPRSNAPLGRHAMYAAFGYRNQVLATLAQSLPGVGFIDGREFRTRSAEDRLLEWASHKAHWIVPTLNDIPQRLFDALVTGGIPIVPDSLRHVAPVRDLPAQSVVFYTAADVLDPTRVVSQAIAKFDMAGPGGIVARHLLALQQHHGDQRLASILARVEHEFDLAPTL